MREKFPHLKAVKSEALVAIFIAAFCVCLFWLYSFADGLVWGFDDVSNLKGLSSVEDRNSLISFVMGGAAGPTGRPVSLLAFLPDYVNWPANPMGFVYGTLVWHCLNVLLVFMVFFKIFRASVLLKDINPYWGALGVAVVWGVLPIHASGILMPVQRMTHVSGFFSLLTIALFLYWRTLTSRWFGCAGFILIFAAATSLVLSIYAKENGVVTVTYIALIEFLLFTKMPAPVPRRLWRWLKWLMLLLVPVLILVLFKGDWKSLLEGKDVWHRNFDHSERLATQPVVLWDYLRMVIFPRVSHLGPFHDDYPIYSWSVAKPWIAVGAWLSVISLAFFLMKKRFVIGRIMLFSILFFLAGHQLEASIILLELYFEHRNYLPTVGFAFLVVFCLASLIKSGGKILLPAFVFSAFLAFNAFSVQQLAALWGQPLAAAEIWYKEHESSSRAAQMLASQYQYHRFADASLRVLDEFSSEESNDGLGVAIQAMTMTCKLDFDHQLSQRFNNLYKHLESLRTPGGITTGLADLGDTIRQDRCEGVSADQYRAFLIAMAENPHVSNTDRVVHHVYFELALTLEVLGDREKYIEYMKLAYYAYPSSTVAQRIAAELFREQRLEEAIQWLDEAKRHLPASIQGKVWASTIDSMREALLSIQLQVQNENSDQ